MYDECAYNRRIAECTAPLTYQLYEGKFQNDNKCRYNNTFVRPFDGDVVDVESDLKNITRRVTKCNELKYNPKCTKSKSCISTFDRSAPVILDRNVCAIIQNNIKKTTNSGINFKNYTCKN
jgi:hypothetical protein